MLSGDLFPKDEFLGVEMSATQEDIEESGHERYPLIKDCRFEVVNASFDFCENSTFKPFVFQDLNKRMKKCYILNARWAKATLNLPTVPTRAVLKLIVDFEPEEYFGLNRIVSGQLAIHSPWNIHNPFVEGFTLLPGKTYIVHLKEDIKNLLPYPYQTNCTDYIQKWRSRGKNGPLSKEMCIEECILNQTMDNCHCVLNNNLYPHNFKFCGDETDACTEKVNFTHCFVKCSPACHSRHFDYRVQEDEMESMLMNADDLKVKNLNWNRTAILIIIFKRTQVNIYRYRAKYETIEFFSFMGGFVGIWLGVSLIALLDFLESLSTFCVFLFDRFRSSKQVTRLRSAIGSRVRSNSTFSTDSTPWGQQQHVRKNSKNLQVRPGEHH